MMRHTERLKFAARHKSHQCLRARSLDRLDIIVEVEGQTWRLPSVALSMRGIRSLANGDTFGQERLT